MELMAGKLIANRRCYPIRSNTRRSYGALKIHASPTFRNSRNMRWLILRTPAVVLASLWHSHLDLLLSRSAALGKSQAYAGSPSWRLVGRQQNWHVASPDRDFERLADDLSRGAKNAFQLDLSARPGSVRPSRTGQVPDSRGFLDVCARGGL